jgi:hypothetical protein
MSTRMLAAGSICCLALLFSGCQTVSHSTTPIVGDSMSIGPGCGPGGCTAEGGGYVDGGYVENGYSMDGSLCGCAGDTCDGRCGGRCGLAQMGMRMRGRAGGKMPGNHRLASAIDCNHRRCANGSCGGVAGPEMGAVTYPYYTLRGPRDFLTSNPPPIGP